MRKRGTDPNRIRQLRHDKFFHGIIRNCRRIIPDRSQYSFTLQHGNKCFKSSGSDPGWKCRRNTGKTILFVVNPKLKKLIESFLNNPVTISVKTGDTNKNIEQNVVRYKNTDHKLDQLHDSLIHVDTKKAIIFEETKRRTISSCTASPNAS